MEIPPLTRMPKVLGGAAWESRDTVAHARGLLGQWLVVRDPLGATRSAQIVETEAYDGPLDRACHAAKGRTARTETMFGPSGHWYVYLCYGLHEMLNLVTGPIDYPAAVLIRGVAGVSGPGRLTRQFGLGRHYNGRPASVATGLWIESDGTVVPDDRVAVTPRIGVDYAGPEWAGKPWRFVWRNPNRPQVSQLHHAGAQDSSRSTAP